MYALSLMTVFTVTKKASKRVRKAIGQAKSLRKRHTKAELLLWQKLRAKRLYGFKFRRQSAIDSFIVDFYCAEKKLIIEVDGSVHKLKYKQDYVRDKKLEYMGYRVIRFKNKEIINNLDTILNKIAFCLLNDKELHI